MPFFQIIDVIQLLSQRTHLLTDLAKLKAEVAAALAAVGAAFPCSEQDLKFHTLWHLAEQIERLGPAYVVARWSNERQWHLYGKYLHNTARPEASIASGVSTMAAISLRQLQHAMICMGTFQRHDRSEVEFWMYLLAHYKCCCWCWQKAVSGWGLDTADLNRGVTLPSSQKL
jgi:Domain of unknown function (DUF4218)